MGRWVPLVLLATAALPGRAHGQALRSPSQFLGFEVGADSLWADWREISSYAAYLSDSSPVVSARTIGRSTLGRDLVLLTITSRANHSRLDTIRTRQRLLANPDSLTRSAQDSIIARQPAVVLLSNGLESTGATSSLAYLELAHALATDTVFGRLLSDVVVLMLPSSNPDGLDTVVHWYRAYQGTQYEAGPLPWMAHAYAGDDLAEDWFMLTQPETQAISRTMYLEWFPQVVWDMHEASFDATGSRMTLPPYRDPIRGLADPSVLAAINDLSTRTASDMTDAGFSGLRLGDARGAQQHGAFAGVAMRHNMLGISAVFAAARFASPVDVARGRAQATSLAPFPWFGDTWRIGDVLRYQKAALRSLLEQVARNRIRIVDRQVFAARRAIESGRSEAPYAFILPRTRHRRWERTVLLNALSTSGVRVRRTAREVFINGQLIPTGSYVIPMDQPFRAHVLDLLEPEVVDPTGDSEGPEWSLTRLMGLDAVVVDAPVNIDTESRGQLFVTPGTLVGTGNQVVLRNESAAESRAISQALAAGARAGLTTAPLSIGGDELPAGSVVLESDGNELDSLMGVMSVAFGFDVFRTNGISTAQWITERPRVAVYQPWTGSVDGGWLRWVLDFNGLEYESVRNSDLRSGRLRDRWDVIVFPSVGAEELRSGRTRAEAPPRFVGGLGESGEARLIEFVRRGGTIVALDQATDYFIETLDLPVRQVVADEESENSASRFSASGPIFGVNIRAGSALTSGIGDSLHIMTVQSRVFEVDDPSLAVAVYGPNSPDTGAAQNADLRTGKAALVDVEYEDGRVILIGFRPQYRGQAYGTFKVLFNAMLLPGLR